MAELALARGERHRVGGDLVAAEAAYFEATREAMSSAAEGAEDGRHLVMRARIGLGRVELLGGSPDRALGWFLSAREVAPDDWEPLYWQGCAHAWLGDYKGGDRSFTAALRLNTGDSSILIQRAYTRFKMGDLPGALDDLLAADRRSGLDDSALLALASLSLERREWVEAERILGTLLDRDPSNVRASTMLGIALEWRERPEEAIEWYERAAGSGDVSSLTCSRLGVLHARAGRPEKALAWFRRANVGNRTDDGVLFHHGLASFETGLFNDSVDAWGELRRRHPDRQLGALVAVAKHELARELLRAGGFRAALPLLEDCISCDVGGSGAVRALAEVRLRLAAPAAADRSPDGYETAKELLGAAAPLPADGHRLTFFRGLVEWADGNPSAALPLLERAGDFGGLSRPARLAVVRCALEAGELGSAERQLLRVTDQPNQHVRGIARCLGAGNWSDAADLLLAGDGSDLRAELSAPCLVRAGRWGEVDWSSPEGPRAGLVRGLAAAALGELDDARVALQAVAQACPDLRAARVALTQVERLLALRAVEAGSWEDAADLLVGSPGTDGQPGTTSVLDGLILLMAGRRHQATTCLEEALRRDPADNRVLHAVTASWFNGGQEGQGPVSTPIAAVAALVHDEGFWERFRSSSESRYQGAIATPVLVEFRRHVERRAHARAGPTHELLFLREMAAAGVLRDLGGFPAGGGARGLLVCGPLMISLLGLERMLGDFLAGEPGRGDPRSGQWRRLRQLFSGLGAATALLDAERPEEALVALEEAACERCRSATAREDHPSVCAQACPDFDARHPSYARLPAKGRRLAEDAARLLVAAQLGVARRIVAAGPDDLGPAIRLWEDAVRVATVAGAPAQVQRQIADTMLGRTMALAKQGRLAAAIELVDAAEHVLQDSPACEEVQRQLVQLLIDRGVIAANDDRLEHALDDLRRAVRCGPHSSRALVNLSLALQRLADQRREQGDRAGEYERLREANRMLEDAAPEMSGSPELRRQLVAVRRELRTVCNRWAIELAAGGQYEEALEVAGQGLAELPGDAQLRISQQNIENVAGRLRGDPDR
ncbi:MAG: tetratricopeptide repeat protein [Pseudonocardia sp.]